MKQIFLVLGLTLFMVAPASAHHHWSSFYDVHGDIEIEGVISKVVWRNPHVIITFTANPGTPDEKVYTTESNSVAALTRMGVTRHVIAVGTKVKAAGYPNRTRHDDFFMNNLLLPGNREVVFLRTGGTRWPGTTRIGDTRIAEGLATEPDFSKRPTTVFSVWSTNYSDNGSHAAIHFTGGDFKIDYAKPRGSGNCVSKDVWEEMGSPYPMELKDNGDGTVTIHAEEYDTIRTVHMGIAHKDPGIVKNNLGYSTGRMQDGKLLVTTTFKGSNSPVQFDEIFELNDTHDRLNYTATLSNPESDIPPAVAHRWWYYMPEAFVQPYECRDSAEFDGQVGGGEDSSY